MTVTVSTNTDPNGTPKTTVLADGIPHVQMCGTDRDTLRNAWGTAKSIFANRRHGTLRRWDGDAGLLHTVAEK